MALPTVNDVGAVDPVLTNMLVGYQQDASRFVASRVFPAIPVPYDSGTYYIFTKSYWFLDEMKQRAPGSDFPVADFGVSTDTFTTVQWALETHIADEIQANSQVPMDLRVAKTQWLAQQSLLRKERAWAADFMKTSVWTNDNSVSNKWSDYQNSDPVADFLLAKREISQLTGMYPNVAVMGEIVLDRLLNHPDLIDRLKYVGRAGVDDMNAALGSILGLNILVGLGIYNSANEGQTGSYSAIIDDDCLVLYTTPTPGIFEASAGYTFAWGGGGGTGSMYSGRDDRNQYDYVQIKEQWDQKVVSADCGVFHSDCVD